MQFGRGVFKIFAVTNLHEGAKLFDEIHATRVERWIIFLISNVKDVPVLGHPVVSFPGRSASASDTVGSTVTIESNNTS